MSLEQKEPTKDLAGRTGDVVGAVSVLDYMPKYPDNEKSMAFICKIIAGFVETVEVNHYHPEAKPEECLGWVVPINWLVEEVAKTCAVFPPPIRWRRLYETRFTPLDGKTSVELEGVLE